MTTQESRTIKSLGERLRAARVAKFGERSLTDVAGKLECAPGYLSEIERGISRFPASEAMLRKMAEVYGVDGDEIVKLSGRVPEAAIDALRERPAFRELVMQLLQFPDSALDAISTDLVRKYRVHESAPAADVD